MEPTESTLRDGTVRIVGGEAVVDRSPSVDVPFEVTNLGKTTVRPTDLAIESNVDDVSCLSRTGSDALYGTWSDEGDGIVWRSDYPLDPEETLRVELPVRAHCGSFGSVDFGGATGVVVDPPLPCDRAVRVRLTVGERIEVYDADVPDMVDGSEYVSSDRIAFLYGVRNVGQSDVEPHVTVYAPEWWRRGSVLHDEFETIAPGQEEEGQTTRSVAWLDRTREGWFGATVRDAITDRVLAHRRTHKVLQRTG